MKTTEFANQAIAKHIAKVTAHLNESRVTKAVAPVDHVLPEFTFEAAEILFNESATTDAEMWSRGPEEIATVLYAIHQGATISKAEIKQLWIENGPDKWTKRVLKPDVPEILSWYRKISREKGTLDESPDQKAYLDASHLNRRDLAHLQDELERAGLVIGRDFFIKSSGGSWITYAAYDREPLEILQKYRVGEEEDLDEAFADQGAGAGATGVSGEEDEYAPTVHRVSVVLVDPNATAVSQRGEEIQKIIRITGSEQPIETIVARAKNFYKNKGYRVIDAEYLGEVDEELGEGHAGYEPEHDSRANFGSHDEDPEGNPSPCSACRGSGTNQRTRKKCEVCNGSGNATTDESISSTIKKGVKSVKRGLQGWPSPDYDGEKNTPRAIVKRNREYSDDTAKGMTASNAGRKMTPHSPGALQQRTLDRKLKNTEVDEDATSGKQTFTSKAAWKRAAREAYPTGKFWGDAESPAMSIGKKQGIDRGGNEPAVAAWDYTSGWVKMPLRENATGGATGAGSVAVSFGNGKDMGGFSKKDVNKKLSGYGNMLTKGGKVAAPKARKVNEDNEIDSFVRPSRVKMQQIPGAAYKRSKMQELCKAIGLEKGDPIYIKELVNGKDDYVHCVFIRPGDKMIHVHNYESGQPEACDPKTLYTKVGFKFVPILGGKK